MKPRAKTKSKIASGCEAMMKMLLCQHQWSPWQKRLGKYEGEYRKCKLCGTRETQLTLVR